MDNRGSLQVIIGEIANLNEEEARLTRVIEDVCQRREIKLGQQAEFEEMLGHHVSLLKDLKRKEHFRVVDQELQPRHLKNDHISRFGELDLKMLSLQHGVKSVLCPKQQTSK